MNIFKRLFKLNKLKSSQKEDEYQIAYQHAKKVMRHGHLNMGSYSDDVDVEMWLPEMNSYNVTILCDRLLIKNGKIREGIFAITGEVFKYISIFNIEQQSSGFKILEKIKEEGKPDMLFLKVSPEHVKSELMIPNEEYVWGGFTWGKDERSTPTNEEETTHTVPSSKYGHQFILNFSVSGEFGLEIYFIPKNGGDPIGVFSKSFLL